MNNLILYAVLAAVILGGLGLIYRKADQGGYRRCEAEFEAAQQEADLKAQNKQKAIRKQLQEREDEIRRESPALGDRPVGPVLLRQLERLRGA